MHGRKREDENAPGLSDEARAARAAKIAKYNAAKSALLQMRAARVYDASSYGLTGKLAELNPDFYTLWNFRKEIVNNMIEKDPASQLSLLESELTLCNAALLKNPKCYSAWHHRVWVLGKDLRPVQDELALCGKMLQMDARNFHCWNYRRAVAALAQVTPESEFAFTTDKINENFSNYSAWHYRTVLIPRMYTPSWLAGGEGHGPAEGQGKSATERQELYEQFIDAEFQLVKGAFYTEPEDQSAWLYHRWLLGRVVASSTGHQLPVLGISLGTHLFGAEGAEMGAPGTAVDAAASTAAVAASSASASSPAAPSAASSLHRQLRVFRRELREVLELLSVEEDCKWALLTSAILQAGVVACLQEGATPQADDSDSDEPLPTVDELTHSMRTTFERLRQLDPMRKNYYESVQRRFMEQ